MLWGRFGELFLGRVDTPRCTLPGALLDPAGSMCCRYVGVLQRMPTSRLDRGWGSLLMVTERNAVRWPR